MGKLYLGVETSCDDTSLALFKSSPDGGLLWFESFSQDFIMAKWGGVVPEIAARNHTEKLNSLFKTLKEETSLRPQDLAGIGVTTQPGLLGPLLTGLNFAKTLSLLYQTPIIPVNHLYAHLEAIHLSENVSYPYLGILVSGGHTSFFKVEGPSHFQYLGGTLDDAAGEAFDKGGKLMGLDYPAGAIIDKYAKKGSPKAYDFPIGLSQRKTAELSYSGLKTALGNFLKKNPDLIKSHLHDLCASYQEAIILALKNKFSYIEEKFPTLPVVVGGGVACNSRLREVFPKAFFVKPKFCTDNGAMIAYYASKTARDQEVFHPESLWIDARNRYKKKHQRAPN